MLSYNVVRMGNMEQLMATPLQQHKVPRSSARPMTAPRDTSVAPREGNAAFDPMDEARLDAQENLREPPSEARRRDWRLMGAYALTTLVLVCGLAWAWQHGIFLRSVMAR